MPLQHPSYAPPWQSPDAWNAAHPIGTCVRVRLVNGESFLSITASAARCFGSCVVLELEGQHGCWLVSALTPT